MQYEIGVRPVRDVALVVGARRVVINDVADIETAAIVEAALRRPAHCGDEATAHVVRNIFRRIFAQHAEHIRVVLFPEAIHLMAADDPAPVSLDLADEGVELDLLLVAERPVFLREDDDPARPRREQLAEPLAQGRPIVDSGCIC